MSVEKNYLIRKGGYYYRANYCGYTREISSAGRYTREEAEREASIEPWHMEAVPVPADAALVGEGALTGVIIPPALGDAIEPNIAMECLLETMRDNPGAISLYAAVPAVRWALDVISRLRSAIACPQPVGPDQHAEPTATGQGEVAAAVAPPPDDALITDEIVHVGLDNFGMEIGWSDEAHEAMRSSLVAVAPLIARAALSAMPAPTITDAPPRTVTPAALQADLIAAGYSPGDAAIAAAAVNGVAASMAPGRDAAAAEMNAQWNTQAIELVQAHHKAASNVSDALLAARDAQIARLASLLEKLTAAAETIESNKFSNYRARNGRMIGIESDDGERCDIVHSDLTFELNAAAEEARAALTSDAQGGERG